MVGYADRPANRLAAMFIPRGIRADNISGAFDRLRATDDSWIWDDSLFAGALNDSDGANGHGQSISGGPRSAGGGIGSPSGVMGPN